jgi:predicted ATPase
VHSLGQGALALWYLGYPEQSRTRIDEGLDLAQEFAHPFSHVQSLFIAAELYGERGDGRLAQEYADAEVAVSREHGFPVYLVYGTVHQGKMLMTRGQWAEGVSQVKQGLEMWAGEFSKTRFLAWLARGYGEAGQVEDGLTTVAEALRLVEKNDDRHYEAELYRIKGTLTLEARGWRLETSPPSPQASSLQPQVSSGAVQEAEGYFLKAIEITQKQQAKSLELRAVMSLARLWQSQGKITEARQMLADVYHWFTEGFDTKDLQEAKALLEELRH